MSTQRTITCVARGTSNGNPNCLFQGVTIGKNEAVRIEIDPENTDVSKITWVQFERSSSIHSIPREVFTKFPNVKFFTIYSQGLREVQSNAFANVENLVRINLAQNYLTFLDRDTFKGKIFISYF
jgi:hypothetical protein